MGSRRARANARRRRSRWRLRANSQRLKRVLQTSLRDTGRLTREWGIRLARLLAGALIEIWRVVAWAAVILFRLLLQVAAALEIPVQAGLRAGRSALRVAQREVTPARTAAAVTVAAAVLLGVSQFVDYRGVAVGAPAYEGVEAIAPAPQTDRVTAGSAHAYVLLPVAALALIALAFAYRGRWRLGRVISVLGLAGVAVSLAIDLPRGLDEGIASIAFEGARAELVEGFWVQIGRAHV